MEHHGADEEEDQWAIPEEHPDAFHFAAFLAVICATGELVVNLGGSDQKQDENRGDCESHDEEEDAPVGNEVAEEAHRHGGNHVTCRVERLIATLAGVECGTSDDPERHRADGWDEDAGCAANQDLSAHDGPERRKQCDQQRPRGQRGHGHTDQRSLRSEEVNERASRRLRENSCDPTDGEREPDALFVPLVASEVNREERPHSRLHVGEKEIEPVEATQRSPRRGRFGLNGGVRLARSLHQEFPFSALHRRVGRVFWTLLLAYQAILRARGPDLEAHTLAVLEETDDLEEIVGARVAGRPQHSHETLGGDVCGFG